MELLNFLKTIYMNTHELICQNLCFLYVKLCKTEISGVYCCMK